MAEYPNTTVLLLAAGFGTRLRPVTEKVPKALVPVAGIPILQRIVDKFLKAGFVQEQIIVNTHYLAEQVQSFLAGHYPAIRISHEPQIRGTGGAVDAILNLVRDQDLLIHNADIICDFDLEQFIKNIRERESLAFMLLRSDPEASSYGSIVTDEDGNVRDIADKLECGKKSDLMFTGIHYIRSEALKFLIPCEFCSIIDNLYVPLIKQGKRVGAVTTTSYWNDIGTRVSLLEAERRYRS